MELDDRLRQKVVAYKPFPEALQSIRRARLLLLVGISGAGKNAIEQYLLASYPHEYKDIVTHVTRHPRPGEVDGSHYHFIDFATADHMLDEGAYIESAIVHAEDVYGSSIAEVKRIAGEGKIATADITIEGADHYIGLGLNAKAVFLLPPSYEIWQERFNKREDAITIPERIRRLQSALREINHALNTSHYYIVVNDDLESTAELVNRIAHGEPVEPHYHKAVQIAEDLERQIAEELSTLDA
jgi:guanylate kinase